MMYGFGSVSSEVDKLKAAAAEAAAKQKKEEQFVQRLAVRRVADLTSPAEEAQKVREEERLKKEVLLLQLESCLLLQSICYLKVFFGFLRGCNS